MVANCVILHSDLKSGFQSTVCCGAHLTVMHADPFGEGSCLPAVQTGRKYGNMIDASALQRQISADRLIALSPKELTAPPHILNIRETVVVLKGSFAKGRACNSKS